MPEGDGVHVLIVEDDLQMQYLLSRICTSRGYTARTADSAETALALIEPGRYQVALVDIVMAGMSGLELIPRLKTLDPHLEVIMVTGREDRETAVDAFRVGALDYIVKPFKLEDLLRAIARALDHRTLTRLRLSYQVELEQTVQTRTAQLRSLIGSLQDSYDATIAALGRILAMRDRETASHTERVVMYAQELGRRMGLEPGDEEGYHSMVSPPTLIDLRRGSLLHDLGKISIPDRILLKAGPLTDEEWILIQRHPVIGYQLLEDIPFLAGALPIIRHHHERWDGRGYPDGLVRQQIPLGARLFSVADSFDAMTSDRPYRSALPLDTAVQRLRDAAGKQLDPEIVELFVGWLDSCQADRPLDMLGKRPVKGPVRWEIPL